MLTSLIWNFTYLMIVMMFIYIILFNTFLRKQSKCCPNVGSQLRQLLLTTNVKLKEDAMWGHAYTRKRRARDGRRATEDLGAVTMQAGVPAEDMA